MKQHTLSSFRLELFNAGQFEPPKAEFGKHADKLKAAVEKYGSVLTLDFYRGVAHCVKY